MKVASFFAGAGGMDLGFKNAGLQFLGQMNTILVFGQLFSTIILTHF